MTWTNHGESAQTPLLAGVLPRTGIHFLIGPEKSGRSTIAADLAAAIAADDIGCGLSPADSGGTRASLAGFFGYQTGAPSGVAIITDTRHAGFISNAINAAALARSFTEREAIAAQRAYTETMRSTNDAVKANIAAENERERDRDRRQTANDVARARTGQRLRPAAIMRDAHKR